MPQPQRGTPAQHMDRHRPCGHSGPWGPRVGVPCAPRGQAGPVGGDTHCGRLQAGQYASVFVDNGSGAALTIQSGSSFSGLLLGT